MPRVVSNKSNETRDSVLRNIAISWCLHSMKEVLGMEEIRNIIIRHFIPKLKYIDKIRTFDAFQQYDKPPFDDKKKEIIEHCKKIIKWKSLGIFTATNIQINNQDYETHYQCFIVDNKKKQVYAIDPAMDHTTETGYGIYDPTVSYEVIQPFFEKKGYTFQYIKLTNPAQINEEDVFCQSWSLYILIMVLLENKHTIDIPKLQIDKYVILLDFYKKIIDLPDISSELDHVYKSNINENKDFIEKNATKEMKKYGLTITDLLNIEPSKLIKSITASEMGD
jgi:hypothetical protein